MTDPEEFDFSDINETNAPRTMGELNELTEGRPLSKAQWNRIMDLSAQRTANEETDKKEDKNE